MKKIIDVSETLFKIGDHFFELGKVIRGCNDDEDGKFFIAYFYKVGKDTHEIVEEK